MSTRRLRLNELGCWLLAALLALAVTVSLASDEPIAGIAPTALFAALFGWQAWRQRKLRTYLTGLGWDELLPTIRRLRGTVFDEAVAALQAEAGRGPGMPPSAQISESDDCRHHHALVRLRPGLFVELKAKDTAVRVVGATLTSGVAADEAGPSLGRALVLSALLVLVDAFMFNQGIISLGIGLVLLVGWLPCVLLSRDTRLRRPRLRNLAVYLAAVAVVLAVKQANAHIARERADVLVAAVKSFHAKYSRYPASLDELVPEFAREIPPAKYVLVDRRFRYVRGDAGPLLFYTALPPFGRRVFDFSKDSWTFRD